jgi:ATP-dependent RNA helicase SUPV3L1/SUV3
MRGMRDKEELNAVISDDGAIQVEDHFVGRLKGFRFSPDTHADGGIHGKAARNAAAHVLSRELALRARRVAAAKADAFKITRQGKILWRDEEIARLEAGADPLKPGVSLLTDEHLSGPDKEKVQARLDTFISELVGDKLKPLAELGAASDIAGLGRGIAFRLIENFGVLKRETIAEEIKSLDQNSRAQLRKYGVRFGAFNIYIPAILKPAAAELSATLWTLKHAQAAGLSIDALPEPPRAGLTSVAADAAIPEAFYRAYGFHVCGPRAVRLDILERLADQIRPLLAWRANAEAPAMPPKGSTGDGAFTVTPDMMSILGCSPDELGNVLRALGFRSEKRPVKVLVVEHPAPASETSVAPIVETAPEQAAETPAAAAETEVAVPEAVADVASPGTVEAATAPVSSEEPAAETSAATDAALEPAAAAKAEEEKFEEIWRPRRHRHEREQNRGPRRDRGQHSRRPNTQQGAAQPVQAAPANGAAAPAAEGTPPVAADQAAAQPQRERHDRDRGDRRPQGDKREGGRRDGEKRQDRSAGGRPGGDRGKGSFADRKGGGGGGDRRRRDEQRGPPEVRHAAPPRKTGAADPDSPFASLGALREALEKRTKEKSP